MNKYKIKFSPISQKDINGIIKYLKNQLKEPIMAKRYAKMFHDEIQKLAEFPERFAIISEDKIRYSGIRKLIIKNYIVFYRVIKEKCIVSIERVMYGASDWENKL